MKEYTEIEFREISSDERIQLVHVRVDLTSSCEVSWQCSCFQHQKFHLLYYILHFHMRGFSTVPLV